MRGERDYSFLRAWLGDATDRHIFAFAVPVSSSTTLCPCNLAWRDMMKVDVLALGSIYPVLMDLCRQQIMKLVMAIFPDPSTWS